MKILRAIKKSSLSFIASSVIALQGACGFDVSQYKTFAECEADASNDKYKSECFNHVFEGQIEKNNGIVKSIGPKEIEGAVNLYAVTPQHCFVPLSLYLGIAYPYKKLIERNEINEEQLKTPMYSWNDGVVRYFSKQSFENIVNRYAEDVYEENKCIDPHEITHNFVSNTEMPLVIEEGLATYMELDSRSNSPINDSADIRCEDKGFYVNPSRADLENGNLNKYTNLSDINKTNEKPPYFGYVTASCFWDYLEKNYGHDSFLAIIRKLYAGRKESKKRISTEDFVNNYVVPAAKENIKPELNRRFGL